MGMQKQIEDLLQDRVFEIFYGISQIPRQSFHEEQISRYLVEWAQKRGLFVVRDKHNNVLIEKPLLRQWKRRGTYFTGTYGYGL